MVESNHYAAGRRAALELLRDEQSRERIEKVYIAHGAHGPQIGEIVHLVRKHKLPLTELDRGKFRELEHRASEGTDSQGVIVLLAQRSYAELEDVINGNVLLVAIDGVEDPHNIGAIIRSAEAAGADAVLLPKRGAVLTPAVYKASAGAASHLPIVKIGNLSETIRKLQEEFGVMCVGLAGEAEKTLYQLHLNRPICLVVGGEEKGLHRLVRERCEELGKIPLAGKTASLNASVATGVALFEVVRQRTL
jgi:23S rRNA (guanosine2251-2'-O)-methyltransferase